MVGSGCFSWSLRGGSWGEVLGDHPPLEGCPHPLSPSLSLRALSPDLNSQLPWGCSLLFSVLPLHLGGRES